ncbi:tRNA glutamyl-Q(34) synthetase GluQRS [Parasedimentitalea huanghaiensis]|uniref:tRNA glutamyl-Q(34) synthetase GluQRS n=1 Tax=Parasedimentitalea huanghaiensis TaxID=2682100 RepID=A0A6L6W9N3_9RHOB|nr:tRNA glutamyl-Q(34) synthetase GluQRS [Zongyanglinia huanghaiensis]MVO14404.1 tRNA glutamyl-Q(34) synthetase GluQRS [Zongyanglinia huanghaiensis]
MKLITRFAPSPTGPLHLGHAYSAMLAHDMSVAEGGDFLLRIDDLDQSRAREHWEEQIYEDLSWLGLSWATPCRKQSECQSQYDRALTALWDKGLLYECTCSRRDIRDAQSAPQEGAPLLGPDGLIYPGTCRAHSGVDEVPTNSRPKNVTLRLNLSKALSHPTWSSKLFTKRTAMPEELACFIEMGPLANTRAQTYEFTREQMLATIGDVVVCRKDMGAAYHLAVVVDDTAQKVNHVVRGDDLLEATMIHRILGHLIGNDVDLSYSPPNYYHHPLVRDDVGKRLAKRDDARAISKYRSEGASPQDIRKMVGLD